MFLGFHGRLFRWRCRLSILRSLDFLPLSFCYTIFNFDCIKRLAEAARSGKGADVLAAAKEISTLVRAVYLPWTSVVPSLGCLPSFLLFVFFPLCLSSCPCLTPFAYSSSVRCQFLVYFSAALLFFYFFSFTFTFSLHVRLHPSLL